MGRRSKRRRTNAHSGRATRKKKKKASVLEETAPSYISRLPHPILNDILSRLPLKTIFSCRCVSKTWLNVLLDPDFAKLHQTRAPSSIIVQPQSDGLKQYLYAVDLEGSGNNNTSNVSHHSARVRFATETHLSIDGKQKLQLVDSCNGLILLCEPSSRGLSAKRLSVCNPITGDYVIVKARRTNVPRTVTPRLGFCPRTQAYKVVMFVNLWVGLDEDIPTDVYTLGMEGGWRSVTVRYNVRGRVGDTTFLNGSLHWVVWEVVIPEFICSFDIGSEQFVPVPPPLHFQPSEKNLLQRTSLGVLRGCLAMAEFPFDGPRCVSIWVMNDYGVQASWTKECSIKVEFEPPNSIGYPVPYCYILGSLSNGDILVLHEDGTLVSFNQATQSCRLHRIDKIDYFQAFAYTPSFSSLKDIASREGMLNARLRYMHKLFIFGRL